VRVRLPRRQLRLTDAAAALALTAAPLLVGCASEPARERPVLTWTLDPAAPRVGPARLTAVFRDPDGAALVGAKVDVEGHMTHAGMRPVIASGREASPGVHVVPLEFTMAGDWVLLVVASTPEGRRSEHRITLSVQPAGRP
jgi:hypothetical protein